MWRAGQPWRPQARLFGTRTASFAIQGGGLWSPREPHFREKPGPPLRAGGGLLKPRRAVPGVKACGACRAMASWLPWGGALAPCSMCLLGAWGTVPHGLAWPGVPTGPDEAPFPCLSRAASPRVRPRTRTWRPSDLGVTSPALTCLADWGAAVVGVRGCGGGECWGARALLTGLDPHPAPTPPTMQYPSPVPGYPI